MAASTFLCKACGKAVEGEHLFDHKTHNGIFEHTCPAFAFTRLTSGVDPSPWPEWQFGIFADFFPEPPTDAVKEI